MKKTFYQYVEEIDLALDRYTESRAVTVLDLIKNDNDLRRYFFEQAKSLKWFEPLKEQGYFDPETIPYKDGNTLFWDALDFLERISLQVAQNPGYGVELIHVIDDVVIFSNQKKKINNNHIWWVCIKILNNIPNSVIKENLVIEGKTIKGKVVISGFRAWLNEFLAPTKKILGVSEVTERLLPKFLNDPLMIDYAEPIIEAVTRIKPSGKNNPFTKEDEAEFIWDGYWISKGLQELSKNIGIKCSNAVLYTIADRLKEALEFKRRSYSVILGNDQKMYQLKVTRIMKDSLMPLEIGFKNNEFKGTILQYGTDQLVGINIESDYWALHKIDPSIELKSFALSAEDQKNFTAQFKRQLPQDIDWSKFEDFEFKIKGLFGGLNEDYSSVWCKSILLGPEYDQGTEEILTVALRDILLSRCQVDPVQAGKVLESLLSPKYPFPIFKKCALLSIDHFWGRFSDLFGKFLDNLPSPLHASNYEVELQDILRNHNANFKPEINQRLIGFIDDVPEYYVKEGERAVAYWKYKWLSPLKDSPIFHDLYEEFKEKATLKEDKPYEPTRSSTVGGFVKHSSPLTKEEILNKTIPDLVKYLNEYQGADEWNASFEGKPDKEGLKEMLYEAAKENSERFCTSLSSFGQCHYEYVSKILNGIKDAWIAGQSIGWIEVFDFCEDYLRRKDFIKQAQQAQGEDFGKGKYLWVVDTMTDLIESGSFKDERAFAPDFFPKVQVIFDLMYDIAKGEKRPDTQRDAVTYAINTTLGKIIESFIIFSLRVARANRMVESNWGSNRYQRFLDKGIEAYIFLGRYLPQFKYLDEVFTKDKINSLTQTNSDNFEWQMFMEGYLTGHYVYEDLYSWMRQGYIKAIEYRVLDEKVEHRLVQHITIGYLRGYESLAPKINDQESLFFKLLNEATTPEKGKRWVEAANFMWSLSEKASRKENSDERKSLEEVKQKVLNFWAWIYSPESHAQEILKDKYNSFLGKLARYAVLLNEINEISEQWLIDSAINLEDHDTFFIEYLTKFDDQESVRHIGKIFLEMLKAERVPVYKQEDIQLIVQRIYDNGNKEDADDICNMYGRRGIHFLKSVWQRNQILGKEINNHNEKKQ